MKKFIKRFLYIITLVSLLSCGGIKPTMLKPQQAKNEIFEINKIYNREIGESIIESNSGSYFEGIRITKGSKIVNYYSKEEIPVGGIYILKSENEKYRFYYSPASGLIKGVAIPKNGGKPEYFYESGFGISVKELRDTIEFDNEKFPSSDSDFFKQQFLYNGRSGNSMKFLYMEYVNNLARPAFTQELQYDLSESNIIGFKGLRIEIIEANNIMVKYKIIKSFD